MSKYLKYIISILFLLIINLFVLNVETDVDYKPTNEKSSFIDDINVDVYFESEDNKLTLYDYLIGVLTCEMPVLFNDAALKAGVIASRTYYYNKVSSNSNYIASNNEQCFFTIDDMKSRWGDKFDDYYNKISNVVKSTNGEVIYYNGNLINAYYFSTSNGKTEDVSYVFGDQVPYLISVDSDWDKNVNNYIVTNIYTLEEFVNKLGLNNNDLLEIQILSKTSSGRIDKIKVNNNIYSGVDFRKLLGLRSTDFDYKISNDSISITTKGYGHGVGMSQYGANEMAKMGYDSYDILKHYYTGVEISKYSV